MNTTLNTTSKFSQKEIQKRKKQKETKTSLER